MEWNSISDELGSSKKKRNKEQTNDDAKQSETTRTEIERRVERNECTFLGRPLEEINNRESDPFVCVNLNSHEKEREEKGEEDTKHPPMGSGQCEKRRKSCWRLNLVKMNRRRSLRMKRSKQKKKKKKKKTKIVCVCVVFFGRRCWVFSDGFCSRRLEHWIVQEGLVIGVLDFCCWFDMVQAQQGSSSSECGNGSGNGIGSWVWIFHWSGINCRSTWVWFDL